MMKKFTLIFSLMMAMFTTAMAQEVVDLSSGTFSGEENVDKRNYSQWTSSNGVQIIATDADGNEVPSMKYLNNRFQLDINSETAIPIKYTIIVPEGYSINEIKLKNSSNAETNKAHVDYGLNSHKLTTAELTINYNGNNAFYLYGNVGRSVYLTGLTILAPVPEGIEEVKGENGEVKTIYDLTGRRINEITHAGIYIVNGKKVSIK